MGRRRRHRWAWGDGLINEGKMTGSDYVRYVVSYKPSEEAEKKMSSLQKIFCEMGRLTNMPPLHCTIMAFDSSGLLEEEIKKSFLATEYCHPEATMAQLDTFYNSTLVVKVDKNKEMVKNHLLSLNAFERYISMDSDFTKNLGKMLMTPHQKNMYKKYGSPFFGELYNPHISLGKISINYNGLLNRYSEYLSGTALDPKCIQLSRKFSGRWTDIEIRNI